MIPSPLADSYGARFNVRPIKHAFFVPEDWERCEHAATMACTQWGGIRNLIVPINPEDASLASFMRALLHLHEPDRFVDYAYDVADFTSRQLLTEQLARLWPDRAVTVQAGKQFDHWDTSAHVLGSLPEESPEQLTLVVHEPRRATTSSAMSALLFGRIPQSQRGEYRKQTRLERRTIDISGPRFWHEQAQRSPFSSVVNLTGIGLTAHSVTGGWTGSDYFEVWVVDSPTSACAFWNVRATRESTILGYEEIRRIWCPAP